MSDSRSDAQFGQQYVPQAGPGATPAAPAFGREFARKTAHEPAPGIGVEATAPFGPEFGGPLIPGGNGVRTALGGDDFGGAGHSPPAASPPAGRKPEIWRILGAAAIVAVVVGAIWLWGRPSGPPATVLAAKTTENWLAGQPVGAFELVTVPAEFADHFAELETIPEATAAVAVPSGSFVTPGVLGAPSPAAGALTVMRFVADTSAWPEPGPRAGSYAVVAPALGGCAMDVTTLAGGTEGTIDVEVSAADAARYANTAQLDGLVVWPAPSQGWPLCRRELSAEQNAQNHQNALLFESGPPAVGGFGSGAASGGALGSASGAGLGGE